MADNPKELPVFERLRELVGKNLVHIFMKGTPQFPQCGFSARTAEILKRCVPTFSYTNILLDVDVYKNLPSFSNWPTFPQVFVNGELVGGCDNRHCAIPKWGVGKNSAHRSSCNLGVKIVPVSFRLQGRMYHGKVGGVVALAGGKLFPTANRKTMARRVSM